MRTDPTTTPSSTLDQRKVAAGIALALVLLAALFAVTRSTGSSDIDDASPAGDSTEAPDDELAPGAAGPGSPDGNTPGAQTGDSAPGSPGGDTPDEEIDVGVDVEVGSSGESDEGGGEADLPNGGVEPVDPCDHLPADRSLLVTPDPLHLDPTVMASHLVVTNCSDHAVDWTAHTVPKVSLGVDAGTLAGRAAADVPFLIDEDAINSGAYDFTIKVSEPGANTYVDVHAYKGILKGGLHVPKPVIQAAPGSGGCSLQCITKAWLTPSAMSPNVSLEVTTKVDTTLRIWVSTHAPTMDGDTPSYPGVDPIATNLSPAKSWTGPLAPLAPATDYHIVVEATDGNDKVAYQVGTFRTITPAAGPAVLKPTGEHGGCAHQCITTAKVTGTAGTADASINIETTVPASIEVFVSMDAPTQHGQGTPYFPGVDPAAASGSEVSSWTAELTGLSSDTTYHAIVVATDDNGRRAYRTGTFTTLHLEHTLRIAFHRLFVISDGDSSKINRGELAFRFGVNGDKVAEMDEQKIHSGTAVNINDGNGVGHFVFGVGDSMPSISVVGIERDGLSGFCPMGTGMLGGGWGHIDSCNVTYNTASNGIQMMSDFESLQPCSAFEVEGPAPTDRCMVIATADHGSGFVHFQALVALRLLD